MSGPTPLPCTVPRSLPCPGRPRIDWWRLATIATASLILASCRAMTGTLMTGSLVADAQVAECGRHDCRAVEPELGPAGGGCGPAVCPPAVCLPCEPLPPRVRPCLVCDGGDHGLAALPVGAAGLANLTAGDTVARFRPADEGPDSESVGIAVSNCACVFAPRFSSVRQVVRPSEQIAERGPTGLVVDRLVEQQIERLPVCTGTQPEGLVSARSALPGVALEERLGPLAVDQANLPHEDEGRVRSTAHVAEAGPESTRDALRPMVKVGFEVPVAWTCVKAANVLVGGQTPQVVATDRGTATLRFESPGRAELTLCKRAGTDTARSGEELDFMIYLLNSGDRSLTDVVLADALPGRLVLVPGSAVASLAADISEETADDGSVLLTWRFTETLPPGASGFVRFRVLVR
jgi:uncharacterized repeat protein (TIGR01451 family)